MSNFLPDQHTFNHNPAHQYWHAPMPNAPMPAPAPHEQYGAGANIPPLYLPPPIRNDDLRLPPIRANSSDDDVPAPHQLLAAASRRPALKIGGARQVEKKSAVVKKRARAASIAESDAEGLPVKPGKGRKKGSASYSTADVTALLDIVALIKPTGAQGWKKVAEHFDEWSGENERPPRTQDSLEKKYKKLANTRKPTGSGTVPPDVKRAKDIEADILRSAGGRNLDDSGNNADSDSDSDASIEVIERPKKIVTAVAQRADPSSKRSRVSAPALVQTLANSFDPAAQQLRDDARNARAMQSTQVFTLSQQLRDAQNICESLREKLMNMQARLHESERARDIAELELRFLRDGRDTFSHKGKRKAVVFDESFDSDKENHMLRTSSPFALSSPAQFDSSFASTSSGVVSSSSAL